MQELTAQIRDLNSKLQNEKESSADYQRQLSLAKQSVEDARNEFSEYKNKAVKILQSKEKLISDMKSSFGDSLSSSEGALDDAGRYQSSSSSQHEMMK